MWYFLSELYGEQMFFPLMVQSRNQRMIPCLYGVVGHWCKNTCLKGMIFGNM